MTGFLQNEAWQKFQNTRGKKTYEASGDKWHYMAIHEETRMGLRIYVPGGPIADDKKALTSALSDLQKYAKSQGAYTVRVEPEIKDNSDVKKILKSNGFLRAHKDINPEHTVINDVSISDDEIDANFSQTIRQTWRKSDKNHITYSVVDDPDEIDVFLDMIHDVAKRTGMQPHPDQYFRDMAKVLFASGNARLLVAKIDNSPAASMILINEGDTYTYAHAASYTKYRKESPSTALLCYAMHYAHNKGAKYVDLYGVAPEGADENHPWYGFTKFKINFGGDRFERSGTWEFPIKPIRYKIMFYSAKIADFIHKFCF